MFSMRQCINEEAIRNGIAVTQTVPQEQENSSIYNDFIRKLIKVEVKADKRGSKGIWKRESWMKRWMKW